MNGSEPKKWSEQNVTTEDLHKFADLHLLAEMLEWISSEISAEDEELEILFLRASYLIRLREGDVGSLRYYWEDDRFAREYARDGKKLGIKPEVLFSQQDEDWMTFQREATQHLVNLWGRRVG